MKGLRQNVHRSENKIFILLNNRRGILVLRKLIVYFIIFSSSFGVKIKENFKIFQ
jgi:hypothetical protein